MWLRRAVSSAYYALFHDLTRQAAVHLLPHDSSQHQLRVARTFRHQNMKEVDALSSMTADTTADRTHPTLIAAEAAGG